MKLLNTPRIGWRQIASILVLLAGLLLSAPSFALNIGDRVQANGTVNVRSSAAGSLIGTQQNGSLGYVIYGPQTASLSGTSYNWWQVHWDSGLTGWVADIGLAAVATQPGTFTLSNDMPIWDTNPPAAPAVNLHWTSSSNATSYEVYRNGTKIYPVSGTYTGTIFYNNAGLTSGQSYSFYILAKNSAGSTQSNTINVGPMPSAPQPAAVTQTAPTPQFPAANQVINTLIPTLTWSGGSNFNSIQVNLSKSPFGAANLVYGSPWLSASASSTTVTLEAGTSYRWDVTACSGANGGGTCVTSGDAYFSTQAAQHSAPPTISNISPNPVTGSANPQTITIYGTGFTNKPTITLSWTGMPAYTVPAAQVIYVNSTQLQMTITTTTSSDNWTVKVTNPDDQSSNTASFKVVAPAASTTTTSPDYGVWNDNYGCLTSNDSSYNNKLAQLAQNIFKLSAAPTVGTGCITEPYLADRYSSLFPGMENHAGIDFRAPPETSAYAIFGGNVKETLDNVHSTLVIESTVGNQILRIFYLHCKSHNNQLNNRLVTGMQVKSGDTVCQTGSVGAKAAHLHLEVKVKGMDGDNLSALAGSHCNSSFIAFDNSIKTGCNLGDIRAHTVDPVILISPAITITPPTISAFSVTPSSIALGSPLTISLTASDTGGSGLNRVEFKRSNGDGTTNDSNWTTINTTLLSGNGAQTTTVSDQPTAAGTWWYGAWVYDNSGNRIDERTTGRGPLSVTVGTSSTPSDCLFNWAERTYPNLFAPAGATANTSAPYYYRYYPQTRTYLATSSADNHLYYLGPISNNVISDVGAISVWLNTANCY